MHKTPWAATYISNEGRISVGRPDIVVTVELLVLLDVHGGVQVRVAPVATTAPFIKACFKLKN
jgi:hypothetical protein